MEQNESRLIEFIRRSAIWGTILGAVLGALFPWLAPVILIAWGAIWDSSPGIEIFIREGSTVGDLQVFSEYVWNARDTLSMLVWGTPLGMIFGLIVGGPLGAINGFVLGILTRRAFHSIERCGRYQLMIGLCASFLTFAGSYVGFYFLLSGWIGRYVLPATIVATAAAIYASQQVARWYCDSSDADKAKELPVESEQKSAT